MKLTFDSVAVFEEKSGAVKFAGRYIDRAGSERFVICRVSETFLTACCNLTDPTPERLLEAYAPVRERVNGLAAKEIAAGERRPLVDLEHLRK